MTSGTATNSNQSSNFRGEASALAGLLERELVDEALKPFDDTLFDRLRLNDRNQKLVKSGRALDMQLRTTGLRLHDGLPRKP